MVSHKPWHSDCGLKGAFALEVFSRSSLANSVCMREREKEKEKDFRQPPQTRKQKYTLSNFTNTSLILLVQDLDEGFERGDQCNAAHGSRHFCNQPNTQRLSR